jgi:hypothetical protein
MSNKSISPRWVSKAAVPQRSQSKEAAAWAAKGVGTLRGLTHRLQTYGSLLNPEKQAKTEWAKDVLQEVTGGRHYGPGYTRAELTELLEALGDRDWPGIKEEASDVAYGLNMRAHQLTGLNFPMVGGRDSLEKFRRRNAIWRQAMKDRGIPWSTDYLTGGSNYHKPVKVQGAFDLAGHRLSDEEAAAISEWMKAQEAPLTSLLPHSKEASPRWAWMLAKGLLGPKSIGRLHKGLPGATRAIPKAKPLGAGTEGVVFPGFKPGVGDVAIKQFFGNPLGGMDIGIRAAVMNKYPKLFPRVHSVDVSGGRMVMDRMQPLAGNRIPQTGVLGKVLSSSSSRNSFPVSGKGIAGAPNRLAISDVRPANVGLDAAGNAKILDPIVRQAHPTKWDYRIGALKHRVGKLNPWRRPAPAAPASAPVSTPARPWTRRYQQGGTPTRDIRRPIILPLSW